MTDSAPTPDAQPSSAHSQATMNHSQATIKRRFGVVVLCGLVLLTAVGAGAMWFLQTRELVLVSGIVLYHGQPLPDGFVMSTCEDDGTTALGGLDHDGRFELATNGIAGAFVGQHRFVVNAYSREMPPKPLIPAKFLDAKTTPLRINVTRSGPNNFKFELTDAEKE